MTTRTAQGVRRTERYVYNSLHWAFPMLPLAGLLLLVGPGPLEWWSLPWLVLLALSAWAGLAVLHTRLRDADLLPASAWDVVRVRRIGPVRVLWIASSLASAATAGYVASAATAGLTAPPSVFVLALAGGMIGGVWPLPMLGRPGTRPVLVCVVGVVLAQLVVWVGPQPANADGAPRVVIAYWAAFAAAALVGYAVMFVNMLTTTRELEQARTQTARLAVAEERLRFSRDLHDVFGRTLSTVALKAELAAALAERGRSEAAATMHEVQVIAISALGEVREVVRGYRESDLASELAGARTLLEASGVRVTTLSEGAAQLPAPVARAFAWVVREGTTNVLRHSDATHAGITLVSGPDLARLVLSNDRPRAGSDASGSGLAGLAERLAEVGGTIAVGRGDDSFTLVAEVDAASVARLRTVTGDPAVQGTVPFSVQPRPGVDG